MFFGSGARADEHHLTEAKAKAKLEEMGYRSPEIRSIRGNEVNFDFIDENGLIRKGTHSLSKFHRSDNVTPEEGGKYWRSTLISDKVRSNGIGSPKASEVAVAKGIMPAAFPLASGGVAWGAVAVDTKTGKITRGQIVAANSSRRLPKDKIAGQLVFEESVSPDAYVICSDRRENNFPGIPFVKKWMEKRGELVIWNPGDGRYHKMQAGMFLERDPEFMALMAKTYGTQIKELEGAAIVSAPRVEKMAQGLGYTKIKTPRHGVQYTPMEIPDYKRDYAKPALVRFWDRALDNGLIQITDDPISAGVNAGIAITKAFVWPKHNIACIGNKKDKMGEFLTAQKALEEIAALEAKKTAAARKSSEAKVPVVASTSKDERRKFLVVGNVQQARATSALDDQITEAELRFNREARKLVEKNRENLVELKRVESPAGGGHSASPAVNSGYRFFINENRFLETELGSSTKAAIGFAARSEGYNYNCASGYKGGGDYRGYGLSAELSHEGQKGGINATGSFGWGTQNDKGKFHGRKTHPMFYSANIEGWLNNPPLKTKSGWSFLDGFILSADGKTGDYNHGSAELVLLRSPHDILKVAGGLHILNFRNPGGTFGGVGGIVQVMDGIGVRVTKYAGKKLFVTAWGDPYRVYWKYRQLEAEYGIKEIPWDNHTDLGRVVPINSKLTVNR